MEKGSCETTLNGHRAAVTALRFDKQGSLLASGGKDCDVILWDVIAETGLYRLRGHRDQVLLSCLSCSRDIFSILSYCYFLCAVFSSFCVDKIHLVFINGICSI